MGQLTVYNSLTRKKEVFEPLNPPYVGMYVCGPTVYGDPHLGHAKSYVSFDVIYRYLKHLGYKVRYVQNITDVGHLSDDADEGEDKIARQSRLEKLEPMEIVERYMYAYYRDMDALNVLRPSIAPRPSGHIPEQIEAIEKLLEKGFAYVVNGSVYFDVRKYSETHHYGKLSGRNIDELLEGSASRELEKQSEKKSPLDFALWKKADPGHLMQWNSPWGKGYPGWHLECSVMSQKYLGETFDIHGGGNENMFPHHECEIAQAEGITGKPFVRYWLHNNMVTVNGQKMGKSLGNSIYLHELFSGNHKLLEKAYSPMTVRFFILQSHYRSTLDFSNKALQAAEKGYHRLMNAWQELRNLEYPGEGTVNEKLDKEINSLLEGLETSMQDDFNTAQALAGLFELSNKINSFRHGQASLSGIRQPTWDNLNRSFEVFIRDVLGLRPEQESGTQLLDGIIGLLVEIRKKARAARDFETSDWIRDRLREMNVILKDEKDGTTTWTIE